MIVGMRIDEPRKNTHALGMDNLCSFRNILGFNLIGDMRNLGTLNQDICMPGPLGINQKSILYKYSLHTYKILQFSKLCKEKYALT